MDPDFVAQVKSTIFWLNRGLRVFLDLKEPDFQLPISMFFVQKYLASMDLGASQQCVHF